MVWEKIRLLLLLILSLTSVTIGTAYGAVPDPPTALTGIPGNGQVILSWTAPTNDGGSAITDYKVLFKLSTDSSFSIFSDGVSTSTGATVTGLTNGNLYFFEVRTVNSDGESIGAFVGLQPSATSSFTFVAPPTIDSSTQSAMIALGLPPGFVMPSATVASSANFNPFDSSFNQKLEFTTPFNPTGGGSDIFTTYSIQTYSVPTLTPGQVWVVPSSIIPVTGGIGDIAATKLNQIPPNTPTFIQQTGAALPNGAAAAQGIKLNLVGGASGVNVQTQVLSTPPAGAPAGANFYLDYTLTGGGGVNFGLASLYSSPPEISFTVAPVANSIPHPTNPTNSVNSAITCPDVQLALVEGGVEVTTGITVTRDTAGDTSTACGYKGTVLHLSTYTGRARTSGGGAGGAGGGEGVVSTLELIRQRSCDPDGFGSGISLKLYKVSYDVDVANKLWVEAGSTCGPMVLQLVSDGKISAGSISADQPRLDEKIVKLEAPLHPDQKSFSIVLKDKRDSIIRNFYISEPIYEKDYIKIEQWSSQINYTSTLDSPNINATNTSDSDTTIPSWVRNNAKWWSNGSIGDNDFVQGIQFLVENDIIHVSQTNDDTSSVVSQQIPAWIKNNARWWADGIISDNEFIQSIQWLISNGIMKVS